MHITRPIEGTYPSYYDTYFKQVGEEGPLMLLDKQLKEGLHPFESLDDRLGSLQYAPGKWTIAQVLGHINDTERILSYRLLRLARFDASPLPSFEEDEYARQGNFHTRTMTDLYQEWKAIRASTMALVGSLNEAQLTFVGTASGHPVSALALLWILPAHAAHHAAVVQDRYLAAL